MQQQAIAIDSITDCGKPDHGKMLTRAQLDAYDPASESWQKQFSRR